MIRSALVAAFIFAAGPAAADSCSLMLFKDDLADCVKELNSKIFLLRAELQAEQSRNTLNGTLICNLALSINSSQPSADVASIVEAACAEVKERLAAAKKRSQQKAKIARP